MHYCEDQGIFQLKDNLVVVALSTEMQVWWRLFVMIVHDGACHEVILV